MDDSVTHSGGCHCGAIRFEVEGPADIDVVECNCAICSMTGYQHFIVARTSMRVLCGLDALTARRGDG